MHMRQARHDGVEIDPVNKPGTWEANPWVAGYTFELAKGKGQE